MIDAPDLGCNERSGDESMKMRFASVAAACLLVLGGCGKEGEKTSAGVAAAPGAIDVPADGKKFDPAVKAEQLPAGAWYCNMGTAHWAQMKEGDKTCPVCKMKLTQKK